MTINNEEEAIQAFKDGLRFFIKENRALQNALNERDEIIQNLDLHLRQLQEKNQQLRHNLIRSIGLENDQ